MSHDPSGHPTHFLIVKAGKQERANPIMQHYVCYVYSIPLTKAVHLTKHRFGVGGTKEIQDKHHDTGEPLIGIIDVVSLSHSVS